METMAKSFFCLFFFFFNLGNKCSAYLIVLPICPHSAESYFVISHTGYILQQDQHICFFLVRAPLVPPCFSGSVLCLFAALLCPAWLWCHRCVSEMQWHHEPPETLAS